MTTNWVRFEKKADAWLAAAKIPSLCLFGACRLQPHAGTAAVLVDEVRTAVIDVR
jgi:hypothetical protein